LVGSWECERQGRRGICESIDVVCNEIVNMCKIMGFYSVLVSGDVLLRVLVGFFFMFTWSYPMCLVATAIIYCLVLD
jgi:hypothetical protein